MRNLQNKPQGPTGFNKGKQPEPKTPNFQDTHGKPLGTTGWENKNPVKGQPNTPGKMKH